MRESNSDMVEFNWFDDFDNWIKEKSQRNLLHHSSINDEDLVFSDLDEIWNPIN